MAVNYAPKHPTPLSECLDNNPIASRWHTPAVWEPIRYTSLFWWMVMNYALLLLLLSLPLLALWGIEQ